MSTQAITPEQQQFRPVQEVNPVLPTRQNIWETAVLLTVSTTYPSMSKTISSTIVNAATDKKRIHVSKDLFNSKALKNLFSYDVRIFDFIQRHTTPFPLKRGIYLLPADFVNTVENELREHIEGREAYIQACYEAFDLDLENAKQELGELFDPSDYPTKEQYRHSFVFEYNYLQMAVSEKLKSISAEMAAREADKMAQKWVEAGEAAEKVLFSSFAELVSHLTERLSPSIDQETGKEKKKIFRDSMLDRITDFLRTIKTRNLTGNEQLNALADQAAALTQGITPEMLRSNEAMRANIQLGFAQIKETLDKAVTEAPLRSVRFEE